MPKFDTWSYPAPIGKNQPRHLLNWLLLVIAAGLLVLSLVQWWLVGGVAYIGLAAILALGEIVYFTDYWQPLLYLVVSVIISAISITWIVDGLWQQRVIQVALALNVTFVALSLYLFLAEEPPLEPSRSDVD